MLTEDEDDPKQVAPVCGTIRQSAKRRDAGCMHSRSPEYCGARVRIARQLDNELEHDGEHREARRTDDGHDGKQPARVVRTHGPDQAQPRGAEHGTQQLARQREVVREDAVEERRGHRGGNDAHEENRRAEQPRDVVRVAIRLLCAPLA